MTTEAVHWGYTGSEGPDHWGCLSEAYRPCSGGVEQSPLNIIGCVARDGLRIEFAYSGRATTARNNRHTVYLDFPAGNRLDVGTLRYELQGIHYHSPGEHQVDGESFAAELHMVHQDGDGNLAVVGLLYRLGTESELVQHLLDAAPDGGGTSTLTDGPNAAEYVPSRLDYYGYDGSLTTPPCTEGVRWIVMQTVGTVSEDQVNRLQALTGGSNHRPVQSIGTRTIFAVGG